MVFRLARGVNQFQRDIGDIEAQPAGEGLRGRQVGESAVLVESKPWPDAKVEALSLVKGQTVHAHRPGRNGRPRPTQALVELARQRTVRVDGGLVVPRENP